jgi:murein DD-endopeptidase MepM/ murein hydrolase activator NlpD
MPFPLPFVPLPSYKQGGRKFGAPRDGGVRKHAGCDLIAPQWTEIFAIEDGVVHEAARHFYRGTWQISIRHSCGLVRYCEVQEEKWVKSLKVGQPVVGGQIIAHVGKMYRDSMLHFELYKNTTAGPLTQLSNKGFQRRKDLTDPAPLLDKLKSNLQTLSDAQAVAPGAGMMSAVMSRGL